MSSSAQLAPAEGRSSWYAIAAIVLLTLLPPMWIVFGGPSPGKIEGSTEGTPSAVLQLGSRTVFGPGRLDEGSIVACQGNGLTVNATVPAAGRSASEHQDPADGSFGVTTRITHLRDTRVIVRCTN